MSISKVLLFLGLVMGLASALLLYYGAMPIPWSIQSWGGTSSDEKAFHIARHKETIAGLVLLFGAFLFQLFGAFWEDIVLMWQKVIRKGKYRLVFKKGEK